jgi:4-alpha-glucanotransferase
MLPGRLRAQGYRYAIAAVRTLMRRAAVLRIDHVMALHRLFWVPAGMRPAEGTYVHGPAEEWYAILALESWRSGCAVVGEDLGTVLARTRGAMRGHGVLRTAVVQYEARPDPARALPAAAGAVASVNTHDMPTFASYWAASDVEDRLRRGLLDANGAERERGRRAALRSALRAYLGVRRPSPGAPGEAAALLRACLTHLAAGDADLVLVNLEDLWGETRPQNVPGTGAAEPNWSRRARRSLPRFGRDPDVVATLRGLTERRGRGHGHGRGQGG